MKVTRRSVIRIFSSFFALGSLCGGYWIYRNVFLSGDEGLYAYIKPEARWSSLELDDFLHQLKEDDQKLVMASLGFGVNENYDVDKIKKRVLWNATSIASYPFKNKLDYDYHQDILQWLAAEYSVDENYISNGSSFSLERKIVESVFVQVWDKLTPEQRREALDGVGKKGVDLSEIALIGGVSALAALSGTVYLTGFAFYTTMTTVIAYSAGIFGITLPFAVYAGATSAVAAISGPIGWAILGLASLGTAVFMGRASHAKTAAFVAQLHDIKIRALEREGRLDDVLNKQKI